MMNIYETHDPLVAFLYMLLRDYVTPGKVEEIMEDQKHKLEGAYILSNGFLGQYAEDVVTRLRGRRQ